MRVGAAAQDCRACVGNIPVDGGLVCDQAGVPRTKHLRCREDRPAEDPPRTLRTPGLHQFALRAAHCPPLLTAV